MLHQLVQLTLLDPFFKFYFGGDLAGKDTCHQLWQPELSPQNPCGGRRELSPSSWPASTHTHWINKCSFVFIFYFWAMPEPKPRALCLLGKYSTTKLLPIAAAPADPCSINNRPRIINKWISTGGKLRGQAGQSRESQQNTCCFFLEEGVSKQSFECSTYKEIGIQPLRKQSWSWVILQLFLRWCSPV